MEDTTEQDLTEKNLKIAKKFVESISDLVEGIVLSGSNAWGAGYAVSEKSDIDLLIIGKNIQVLEKIICNYVSHKLISASEYCRYKTFQRMFLKNEAEQFSLITNYAGVPVSIDFFTVDTLRKITSLSPMGINADIENIDIRYIKEFRTNPPKVTGDTLDDLCSLDKLIYNPNFIEIKDEKGVSRGFCAETCVDAFDQKQGKYFLGVMAFYLSIIPVVLFEKNKEISKSIDLFQSKIRDVLKDGDVVNITRQERMLPTTLKQIRSKI